MKLLTPLALLVASIGLFFTFISPQYKLVTDVRAQTQDFDDAIVRAKQVVAKRQQLLAQKNSFNPDDLKRLIKLLPDSIDTIQLIIDTNKIANAYGTNIEGIKVTEETSKTTTASPVGSSLMVFNVKMTYEQFQKFLQDFERSLRLIDIAGISFVPSEDGSLYTYTVSLRTYWLKP
jgi:Tfp pilus assembly protein PilO